jgi:hypothetical protein
MGSNNSPFGSGVLQGFLSRLWCWHPPRISQVFCIYHPSTLRCESGENANSWGDIEGPFSAPKIASRVARKPGARPSTANERRVGMRPRIPSFLTPSFLVLYSSLPCTPGADGFFEAWLTSMLREGRRTEISADRQGGWQHSGAAGFQYHATRISERQALRIPFGLADHSPQTA